MASFSLDEEQGIKILRQVEFYFSDSNLPRDNFLKKSIKNSPDGFVSLDVICCFSRMRAYLNLGAARPEEIPKEIIPAVAETLRKSSALKVSEVSRSTELKLEKVIDQIDSRTITASPFRCDIKLEDMEAFFSQHGKFVDYQAGEESGYICFDDPAASLKAHSIADFINEGGLPVKDWSYIAVLEALTGEAEEQYLCLQEKIREELKHSRGREENGRGRGLDGKRSSQSDPVSRYPKKTWKIAS